MYNLNYQPDKNDMLVLKGIAISVIILHNFCHWLPQAVTENQHAFQLEKSFQLLEYIFQGGPHLILNLISHYGHYGVPVFVFLSGYGLVLKYEKNEMQIKFSTYMYKHIKKLWLLLLPLLFPHFLFLSIKEPGYFQEHILDLGMMIGFVGNLHPDHYVFHGPWWFFSLITQLYVIYYLFVYRHTLKPVVILTFICLVMQVMASFLFSNPNYLEYLRYNFVGSMLPFALGIAAARKKLYPTILTSVLLLLLFLLCCFNSYLWLLTFGILPFAVLPVTKLVRANKYLYACLKWIGVMSAFIFVSHPIARACIYGLSNKFLYLSIFLYFILSVLFAWKYGRLLLVVEKYCSSGLKTRVHL